MFERKNIVLIAVCALIALSIGYLELSKSPRGSAGMGEDVIPLPILTANNSPSMVTDGSTETKIDRESILSEKAKKYPRPKELANITGYINSPNGGEAPFSLSEVIGKKVVIVDFWTYSCINCQRTTPHLNEWYKKYKDKGFVIVGVHTPEFEFEKNYANVARAVSEAGIQYPVAMDSNYGTWNAYNNHFWPHQFVIDIDGFIVYDHIGEGGYDETEGIIQTLLRERTDVLGDNIFVTEPITSPKSDDIQSQSPETYFGSLRNSLLGNGTSGVTGEKYFSEPQTVKLNTLYLIGSWNVQPEYAETSVHVGSPTTGMDRINYLYKSKRLYVVAGAPTGEITVEVLRDSAPLEQSVRGVDVFEKNGRTYVTISTTRLYKILNDSVFNEHLIEFVIPKSGLQVFAFTFG